MATETKSNNHRITTEQVRFILTILLPLLAVAAVWGARQTQIDDLYTRQQELRADLDKWAAKAQSSEKEESQWRMEVMVKLTAIETELAHIKEELSKESHAIRSEGRSPEPAGQRNPSQVYPSLQACVQ